MKPRSAPISIWSADFGEVTGQSLVTRRIVETCAVPVSRRYTYWSGLKGVGSWIGACLRLWKAILSSDCELLYLVCSRSNGGFIRDIPALISTYAHTRVVVHVHGSDIADLLSRRSFSRIARTLYARCELVVPSRHLVEDLANIGIKAIHLCENYLLDADVMSDRAEGEIAGQPLTIFWNSNIMASKGFFDLAAAMGQVRDEGRPIRLISIGRPVGDEEMSHAEACDRLSALQKSDWVDYLGPVQPEAVSALMDRADVVALPSRYSSECQPLAIIQAMCAGKTVILGETRALRATAGRFPADFVPTRSVAALADILRGLADQKQASPDEFAARNRNAVADARARFSPARFDREMANILFPGSDQG